MHRLGAQLKPDVRTRSWRWQKNLPRVLACTDVIAVALSMLVAQTVRFGFSDPEVAIGDPHDSLGTPSYWQISVFLGIAWWLFLTAWGTRDIRILGAGPEEYKRVVNSTLALFGIVAIVSYSFRVDLARGYVAVALPTGLVLLLLVRWFVRGIVTALRKNGKLTRRLAILGGPGETLHLFNNFRTAPESGLLPVAAVLPGREMSSPSGEELPVPVISVAQEISSIVQSLRAYNIDAVAFTGGSAFKPKAVKALSWALADHEISLILAPALTDVAGPRIHSQPLAGLPLIHVSTPRIDGFNGFLKRSADVVVSLFALVLLFPLLAITAIAIKVDDPGPAIFKQTRIGKGGESFQMFKFRSMVVNAEEQLTELQKLSDGNGILFKMKSDPRVTRVGSFIRKYSIDELPQLFNVVIGNMSIVGPRPPLQSEVDTYEDYAMRRLKVLPGITGLWQVNGRSDLSWEESIRLDLYYVENWSLMQDIMIVFRTIRVVFAREGAY